MSEMTIASDKTPWWLTCTFYGLTTI